MGFSPRLPRAAMLTSFGLAAAVLALTGCATEYHGDNSGIDGVLWRQIAALEDPLSGQLYQPATPAAHDPAAYLAALDGAHWDGSSASTSKLGLEDGGVVLYEISTTAELSVFIASGSRPDAPSSDGRKYNGPNEVYTCYNMTTDFHTTTPPSVEREILDECPVPLVAELPDGAAFASGEVFDG